MRLRVQVVIEPDEDQACSDPQSAVVHEVATIERGDLSVDTLGMQLAEAKELLQRVQEVLIDEQVRGCVAEQIACPGCGRPRAHKDSKTIVMRTLFGTVRLASPRWRHCSCQPQPTRTFCPLAAALPQRTTPELLYLESKFAGLVSYGQSAKLLAETLPLGRTLHASAVRLHALATGERLESELGPEQPMFAERCQRDWDVLPRPDLPLTVGLDGGYVHSSQQRSRRDGWFEVIAGKSMPTEGSAKCFGFVQTYDTKPKRRLFEVLRSQGMQMNQQVTFFTERARVASRSLGQRWPTRSAARLRRGATPGGRRRRARAGRESRASKRVAGQLAGSRNAAGRTGRRRGAGRRRRARRAGYLRCN